MGWSGGFSMGSSSTKPDTAKQVRKAAIHMESDFGSSVSQKGELEFALKDPTEFGLDSSQGKSVCCVPRGEQVAVESQSQLLGWVPDRYLKRIRNVEFGTAYAGRVASTSRDTRSVVVTVWLQKGNR